MAYLDTDYRFVPGRIRASSSLFNAENVADTDLHVVGQLELGMVFQHPIEALDFLFLLETRRRSISLFCYTYHTSYTQLLVFIRLLKLEKEVIHAWDWGSFVSK